MLLFLDALFAIALCSCASDVPGSIDEEPTVEEQQESIVNGHACTSRVRSSIVGIGLDSAKLPLGMQSRCSGTLIAPNLVLTAHHCLAPLLESDGPAAGPECNSDGTANPKVHFGAASAKHVFLFDDLTSPPIAAAMAAVVPSARPICNHDIGLLVLDRPLLSKTPARIRALSSTGKVVTAAQSRVDKSKDSWLVVAGFGLLDGDIENDRGCQQKTVKVLADSAHPTYYLGKHEFSTSFGTCNGDSGGPVFDRSGLLVGVTSRGMAGCRGPGVYPDLAYQKATLARAFAAATATQGGAPAE